ncbi:unnamed protein product [Phyllotreta striolata]|uniref:Major facilitator superfamily (MFS) profile domain-containing protein n=1 Tax=Phyllotreta striolata TaxID=444603 RepID=A0A9N9TII3_PHYSR|nr:unnamed protein product [Phyllotreta striolata]
MLVNFISSIVKVQSDIMEQIGASCISLNNIRNDEENETKTEKLIASSKSLSSHEENISLKGLFPQIIASLIAAAFHIGNGMAMSYSSVVISQLEKPDSDIKPTTGEKALIASILILVAPLASVFCGVIMDKIGRINTIKTAMVPAVVGWCLTALAKNTTVLITGRALVGIASAFGTSPAIVYIAEISNPKMRMSFLQLCPTYVALGMIFIYLGGWFMHWRLLAWVSNVFAILPCLAVFFIPESPMWLIMKGRVKEAKNSLNWLHKYQPPIPGKDETFADIQFKLLKKEQEENSEKSKNKGTVMDIAKEFLKPTGYKPLIILLPLFFCQHFSGVYITMFYSITFIEEAGTNVSGYFASIMIGVIRLVMASCNIFVLKYMNRRTTIMWSCLGMAVCMFTSGLFTLWIKEGQTTAKWVPVAALLLYVVFSVVGLMFLPFMVIPELFPQEIRGTGYTIGYSLSTAFMFASLESYYFLNETLGGATNLQWFFAIVCLAGLVYTYMFLPETKGKKLIDITTNFQKGWLYIGKSHKEDNVNNNV